MLRWNTTVERLEAPANPGGYMRLLSRCVGGVSLLVVSSLGAFDVCPPPAEALAYEQVHTFALLSIPRGALVADGAGGFLGTTITGGVNGAGTIYRFDPTGSTVIVLHTFGANPGDGAFPSAPLVSNGAGSFYGTTQSGGANGSGTIYRFDPAGPTVTVVHSFAGAAADGSSPSSGLVSDGAGGYYGTTDVGGTNDLGTVYRFDPAGPTVTMLHAFAGGMGDGHFLAPCW